MILRSILLISILVLSFQSSSQNWNNYSVLFGEASTELAPAKANVVRIFIDKNGFIYPDIAIKDRKLRRSESSVEQYLIDHPETLHALYQEYDVPDVIDFPRTLLLLEAIANRKVQEINEKLNNYTSVSAIIHGFRKRAYGNAGYLSTADNVALHRDLQTNSRNMLIIEVYWDGTFISGVRGYKYRGFRLLEEQAIPNAHKVGVGLRRVLSSIETDTLNVVGHSLGAMVVTDLLFDKIPPQPYTHSPVTPPQRINACLLAPAIGSEEFTGYWNRSIENALDNYQFFIFHNENDFVLNKTFDVGPIHLDLAPTEYGNTSLGCDYNGDVGKLLHLFDGFSAQSNLPILIDVSQRSDGRAMGCHLLRCYSRLEKFTSLPIW
ncbi:MAG: hypothetical protein P8L71_01080 [Flavobacteriales bacterium]|nr:hypothetical protein [Flavobacteriales bacterium]